MKNSVILTFLIDLYNKIKNYFLNSFYFGIWEKIMSFSGKIFSASFINYIFCSKREKNYVKESFVSVIVSFLIKLSDIILGKPLRFLKEKYNESAIGSSINYLLKNLMYISLRYYGIFIFAFGFISLAIDRALNGFVSNRFIAITVFGLVLTIANSSVSVLINNEFFIKKLNIKLFKNPHTEETNPHTSLFIALISGGIFGAMGIIPFLQIAIVGIFFITLIFYIPGLLCFLPVVLLPFIPTMAVVALMLFAFTLNFVCFLSKKNKKYKFDGFDLAVSGLIFMNVYGVIVSEKPMSSVKIAAVYIAFILFFYVLRRFLSESKRFFTTLDFFILSATSVAGYGIIEQLFGLSKTTWQDEEMFEEIAGRACSTFENPNVLGEFFILTIPLTVARLFGSKTVREKFIYFISFAMQMLCMIFTYSRGCWLGIIFAAIIFLALCGKKLFVFMTIGVFALPFVVPQSIIDRLLSIGNTADTSTAYRVFIWEGTCRMLKDTWLYGIGLGSEAFNSIYPRYALGAISAPHPHNLYLLILAETGLIGAIMVGIVLLMYFRTTGRLCRISSDLRVYGVGLGVAMGGYLLQGMFDNVWYNYRIYALFIIILAFAAALRDIAEEKNND